MVIECPNNACHNLAGGQSHVAEGTGKNDRIRRASSFFLSCQHAFFITGIFCLLYSDVSPPSLFSHS